MKYTVTIEIQRPRDEVIAIFEDPESIPAWQRGFKGLELIDGEPGETGSSCQLHYDFGKRQMSLTETIQENALPERFLASYETGGVINISDNRFEEIEPGVTRWTGENEFQLRGLMMRVMAVLMPGAFKKQTYTMMEDFKAFVEEGARVDEKA